MILNEHLLGDEPIEQKYRKTLHILAQGLDKVLNGELRGKDRKTGFVLLVFPFEGEVDPCARCNFVSNGADRKDVVALFKEMIARFEGQAEVTGRG